MTLEIINANAERVQWTVNSDNPVTTEMRHVADALTESILTGRAHLAGHDLDESDLIELLNTMRRAAGLTQCDQCRQWCDTGHLCHECATDIDEKRTDRYHDWLTGGL